MCRYAVNNPGFAPNRTQNFLAEQDKHLKHDVDIFLHWLNTVVVSVFPALVPAGPAEGPPPAGHAGDVFVGWCWTDRG